MSNLIIEKTSNEEGKYGEVIAECFYKNYTEFGGTSKLFTNCKLINTTKIKEFQDIDCDFIDEVSGRKIEVKHDTWKAGKKKSYPKGTGNIPYEFATHVPHELQEKIQAFVLLNENLTLNDILAEFPILHERYVGCNEKCKADDILAVGGEEENEENRRYKLINIWNILNPQYKKYAHVVPLKNKNNRENGKEWIHFVWQKEDKAYNIIINIPINNLINLKIAREIPYYMLNNMKSKFPALNEYHTSQEIENLLK